jgi:hypothetical protein
MSLPQRCLSTVVFTTAICVSHASAQEPDRVVLTARRFGYEPLEGDFRVIRPGSFTLRMTPRVT